MIEEMIFCQVFSHAEIFAAANANKSPVTQNDGWVSGSGYSGHRR